MTSVTVNIAQNAALDELRNRIQAAADAVLPTAVSAIDATDVLIVIDADARKIIPETGVGGSTETPHKIRVWVDPTHPNVHERIEEEVKSTIVHELHHAIRNRYYPWPGTLLDDIVGEGLADHFDIEINGQKPKPWSDALSEAELTAYHKRAAPHFDEQNTEEDYVTWVLGSEEEEIPRWAGYALGFKLVKDYLAKTDKKASELVRTESSVFLE